MDQEIINQHGGAIALGVDPSNYGRYESWQATVHSLRADDVVEAVRIEG